MALIVFICIFASLVCRKEFKARSKSLEFLTGIITDLFVDWHRLKGIDSRVTSQRIPELQVQPAME